ncbi:MULTISPECIES: hypothetical protein [Aeromonas]|uniref:hypothetical protein n=1 Tax=Aeromonas TaxID=642 RepID=UPI001FBA3C5F|nr:MULTISPECIES: hypothetical protein [Aeromonas]GKR03752.1 hypothetical protein KAM462_34720 [Aeromonas caviae]GKR12318.1 hypothetical protein KAM465_38950 [Aeromonas caviae]GKR16589.1 hypothetical protein KAM466_39070 [Aeromonas caviae]GKR20816.1 hypothetical protein KAM467_38600 [Aeromonas caviae]GKR25160.1 hypothetical protein KAM468_39000 [Aeromonas caviae]
MTEKIKLALWCTWLSLFALPTWAAPQFTVPTVTKRVPANVEGTLNFASMQFWIETSKGERIMLMPLDEDEPRLIPSVSQPVALNGFMLTYSDGSRYFEPSFASASAASSTTSFTIVKNDDDSIEIRHGGEVLLRTDEYDAIKLTHRLPLVNGQAVLFELHSGGVACPVLYQLAVAQTGVLTMLSQPFGTCSDEGKLTREPNGFTLDLPGNPRQRWVWDASSLTLRKQS